MSQMLYRGVSKEMHDALEGRLIPKGHNVQVVMTRSDYVNGVKFTRGESVNGRFTRILSEKNAIRAHHLESGFHDGAFLSTTRSIELARQFATNGGKGEGYIYVIDPALFEANNVIARQDPEPKYPNEFEVSIRDKDGGEISKGIVIEVVPA
ncbi:enterotoxin A family protein [Shewanella baltica]|uniref:enterotoxin A family protein n=1 Tax=Shewanella baltica TaxID=62322 RepID=UPI00217CE2DA|nr:enterotoxin A family protein [Shewanella baltica]MCS6160726.1 hypothetical protein [Shewanella baltica]